MDRSPNKLNIEAFRKLIMPYLIVDSLIIAGESFSQGFSQFEANVVHNIDERRRRRRSNSIVIRKRYIKRIKILHLIKLIDAALSDLMEHSGWTWSAANAFPLTFAQHGEQLKLKAQRERKMEDGRF